MSPSHIKFKLGFRNAVLLSLLIDGHGAKADLLLGKYTIRTAKNYLKPPSSDGRLATSSSSPN